MNKLVILVGAAAASAVLSSPLAAAAETVTFEVEVPYCTPRDAVVYLRSNRLCAPECLDPDPDAGPDGDADVDADVDAAADAAADGDGDIDSGADLDADPDPDVDYAAGGEWVWMSGCRTEPHVSGASL